MLKMAVTFTNASVVAKELRSQFATELNVSQDLITAVTLLENGRVVDKIEYIKRMRRQADMFDTVTFELTTSQENDVREKVNQLGIKASLSHMLLHAMSIIVCCW